MKDIIRMQQLAGVITEGQAKKMIEVLNEDNNRPNFAQDAETNFPELVKKYGGQVADTLENSYENFSDMYSSPVKINIKYKQALEKYKNNQKDLEELITILM
jgi:hypothetical protein